MDHRSLARRLLAWFGRHGRDMEWRRTGDPWRIWVSEILLQQTRVAAAEPYYRRFLERFPTVESLAAAPPETVLKAWEGLGYYARARNLHAAARIVAMDLGGRIPDTAEGLRALPGVGRSTAGAVAAIAFGRDEPILDGNARRLLSRLFAVRDDARSPGAERILWEHARRLVLPGRGRDTALAVMDLGAVVCTPRNPGCDDCPLRGGCEAFRLGLQGEIPARRGGKALPERVFLVAAVTDGEGRYLVGRRPGAGLLGGMAEFPTLPGGRDGGEGPREDLSRLVGFPVLLLRSLPPVRCAYSHFVGRYEPALYGPACTVPPVPAPPFSFLAPAAIGELPMGRAHGEVRRELLSISAS